MYVKFIGVVKKFMTSPMVTLYLQPTIMTMYTRHHVGHFRTSFVVYPEREN